MADERILDGMRRFWTPTETEETYRRIFAASLSRLEKVTVIIGKTTEGDSASGQVVVNSGDYLVWLDALSVRMKEVEAESCGIIGELQGTGHVNFGNRFVSL